MEENRPLLVISAPVLNNSGYGRHATDIASSLLKQNKYDIKIAFQRWGACPTVNLDEERKVNPYVDQLLSKMLTAPLNVQPDIFLQISIPNEFNPVGKYNIGVTAGIETTVPNVSWIEGLNRMNLNIVPSQHAKNVFQCAKMTKKDQQGNSFEISLQKPIEVVFEGCNTALFKKTSGKNSLDEYMTSIPEDFLYLFVGHWLQGDYGHDRKDVGTLVKLFCETFKNRKHKPALLLKTSGATTSIMDRNELEAKIIKIKETVGCADLPNIYLLHGELNDTEMNDLYNHPKVKAMVNLTHGEGYCRPLLEFSLSGKPIIASGWSGHLDFLTKQGSLLLPGALQTVHPSVVNEWIIKESQWFYVNHSIAMKAMDDVYNEYEKYYKASNILAADNSRKFSMEAFDKVFEEILNKNIPEFPKKAPIVLPKLKLVKKNNAPSSGSVDVPPSTPTQP
jgi:hypothetical protein